jgi:hypothetical protein
MSVGLSFLPHSISTMAIAARRHNTSTTAHRILFEIHKHNAHWLMSFVLICEFEILRYSHKSIVLYSLIVTSSYWHNTKVLEDAVLRKICVSKIWLSVENRIVRYEELRKSYTSFSTLCLRSDERIWCEAQMGKQKTHLELFFSYGSTALNGPGPPRFVEVSRSHSVDTPHYVGLLRTRDQLVAETSTWQHTTLTRDRHPCPRGDSNPRS